MTSLFTQMSTNVLRILTTAMCWQLAPILKNPLLVPVTQGTLVMASQHAAVQSVTSPDYFLNNYYMFTSTKYFFP